MGACKSFPNGPDMVNKQDEDMAMKMPASTLANDVETTCASEAAEEEEESSEQAEDDEEEDEGEEEEDEECADEDEEEDEEDDGASDSFELRKGSRAAPSAR